MTDNNVDSAAMYCRETLERGGTIVLVPDLLGPLAGTLSADSAPQLSRLLHEAERLECCLPACFESLLIESLFADQNKTCAAAIGYHLEYGQLLANALRTDPAYQQIDMNNATLAEPCALNLKADEADAILLTLNEHFAADGLRFVQKDSQRWYCLFDRSMDIHTVPYAAAAGRDVAECRPTGDDARAWRSKLAEVEMLLFDHPVNTDRQARGSVPVNSLWLWGEGVCSHQTMSPVTFIGDNFYTESLAFHLNADHRHYGEFDTNEKPVKPAIFSLQSLSAITDSEEDYKQAVQQLDGSVAESLWRQYQEGSLSEILMWCGDDQLFRLQASSRNKSLLNRWRKMFEKIKPLSAYVQTPAATVPVR